MMAWWTTDVLVPKCVGRLIQAFYIIGLCGAAGVLIDLDHVLVLIAKGIPITWHNLAREAGRPLHIPALFVVGIVLLVSYARHDRLLARDNETTRKIVKVK